MDRRGLGSRGLRRRLTNQQRPGNKARIFPCLGLRVRAKRRDVCSLDDGRPRGPVGVEWAKPGRECVHNLGYWESRPYLGLGAGAHSYRADRRWWNLRPPQQYLDTVESGQQPTGGEELLTHDDRRLELVSLGLRTTRGLAVDDIDLAKVQPFLEVGLVIRSNGHLVITERGMLLANEVALALA